MPEEPEAYRQVILRGLMLRENGSRRAVELLEKWTGQQLSEPDDAWDKALASLASSGSSKKYPDLPEPTLPVDAEQNHWTYQELLSFLTGPQASQGVAARGAVLFEKAQCVKCHRYGDRGDTVGPDLTNVSKRFQKKEILESILFPSHVISDQFASQTIVTKDGKSYVGHGRADAATARWSCCKPTARRSSIAGGRRGRDNAQQSLVHARGSAQRADPRRDRRPVRLSGHRRRARK